MVNEFTLGKVDIELLEPEWKPEENKEVVPLQTIKKDPQIKNTGINDAFVYLEVSVPMAEVIAADEAGNRRPSAKQELISFTQDGKWTLLNRQETENTAVYVYGYNEVVRPEQTTAPLFQTVTFLNIIEGQLDGAKLNMPIKAHAIQSANTGGSETTVVGRMKEAYQKYLNQNRTD